MKWWGVVAILVVMLVASIDAGKRNKKNKICRYDKGEWSECDPINNIKTRKLTLKSGEGECEQEKTKEKKCSITPKSCKFNKGDWSECNKSTNLMTRTDTLKQNSENNSQCQKTRQVSKNCKKKDKAGGNECKYDRKSGSWSECDESTMTVSKVFKLKRGGADCPPEKSISRPCKVLVKKQKRKAKKQAKKNNSK